MLKLRIISAVIGVPIFLVSAWLGGPVLFFLVVALMLIALYEMHEILLKLNIRPSRAFFLAGGLIVVYAAYFYDGSLWLLVIPALFFLHLLIIVFSGFKYSFMDGIFSITATLYVSLFIYVYLVGTLPDGWLWMLLLLMTTWANDTFAYFVGTKLGCHKLAPVISPNKTVEGAIGGLLGSVIISLGWGLLTGLLEINMLVVLGFSLAVAGQAGDLVESAIKRAAGIKDSGSIIPGHGGILDRFDSMLLTAPLVYYYVSLFIIN